MPEKTRRGMQDDSTRKAASSAQVMLRVGGMLVALLGILTIVAPYSGRVSGDSTAFVAGGVTLLLTSVIFFGLNAALGLLLKIDAQAAE